MTRKSPQITSLEIIPTLTNLRSRSPEDRGRRLLPRRDVCAACPVARYIFVRNVLRGVFGGGVGVTLDGAVGQVGGGVGSGLVVGR